MGTILDSRPMNSRQLPTPRLVQLASYRSQLRITRSAILSDSSTPRAALCRGRSRPSSEPGLASKQHQPKTKGPAEMPALSFVRLHAGVKGKESMQGQFAAAAG